jgi:hypothetical protein
MTIHRVILRIDTRSRRRTESPFVGLLRADGA